jgi:hypothetical protein
MIFDQASIDILNSKDNLTKVGDFVNKLIPFGILNVDVESKIHQSVNELGFKLLNSQPRHFDAAIPGGFFEIQHHDHSVSEHKDDVAASVLFCVMPFEVNKISESNNSSNPELAYFDGFGKKQKSILRVDSLVIFNPRRPHRLDYFGREVKLIIFSVCKK